MSKKWQWSTRKSLSKALQQLSLQVFMKSTPFQRMDMMGMERMVRALKDALDANLQGLHASLQNIVSSTNPNPRYQNFSQYGRISSSGPQIWSIINTEKLWFFVFFCRKSRILRPKSHFFGSLRAPDSLPPYLGKVPKKGHQKFS